MQKFLRTLLLTAAMLLPFAATAQNQWTVADGTTTHAKVPLDFYNCDGSGVRNAQMLYPASLLSSMSGSSISAITFYHQNTTANKTLTASTWYIKMGTTTETDLSAGFSTVDLTTVYAGNLVVAGGVFTFEFDVPFTYTGGNLIVEIYTTGASGNWFGSSNQGCFGTDNVGSTYSSMSNPNYTEFLPKTTFHEAPSCFPVGNLAIDASATTTNSLTVTWADATNSGATYTVYNGETQVATGLTATTYTLTGLTANTAYNISVVANCSSTDASEARTVIGRTNCGATGLPWTCGFEENEIEGTTQAIALPWCSARYAAGSTSNLNYPYAYNSSSSAHAGSRSLYFYGTTSTSYPETMTFILPQVDVTNYPMNGNRLTFWAKISSTSYNKDITIGTLTDPTDMNTYTTVGTVNVNSTTYTKFSVPLTAAAANAAYVTVTVTRGSGSIYIDDMTLEEMPSCMDITDLTATAITSSGATLTWNDAINPSTTTYTIYNGETQVATGVTGTSYTITGLNPNSDYTFNVQANCTAGDAPMTTVSFHTSCASETMPWSENFDNWTSKSVCWSFLSGAFSGTPTIYSSAWSLTSSSYGSYITYSGKALTMNVYSTYRYWAVTPLIGITTNEAQLSVDVAVAAWSASTPNYDDNDTLAFAISIDGGSTFTTLLVMDNTQLNALGNTFSTITVPVTGYNGQEVRFAIFAGSSASGGDNRIAIDNVAVTEMPSCPPIVGLHIDSQEATTVTVAWTNDEADSHEVEVRQGEQVVSAANVVVTGNSATISGLSIDNDYQVYVRANCGNAVSPWSSALNVHIGYCQPNPTSVDGSGITSVSFGGMTNTTHPSSAAYADYSSMSGSVPAGTTATVDITYATGYTYGTIIWVDWDNSLSFDADEVVYVGTSESINPTTLTATFDIPVLQSLGNYRMRILGADSYFDSYTSSIAAAAGANPCASYSWGVAEDYTLTVTEAPNCLPVYELEATNITANGVTLNWVSYSTGVTYTVTNGNAVVASNVTESSVNIINLQPNTDYTLAVTTMCPGEDSPAPRTVSFRTACANISSVPYTESFEDVPAGTNQLNYCWTRPTGATYPYSYNGEARTGSRSLRFLVTGDDSQVAALPQIDINALPIAGLRLTVWAKGSGNLLVGTMTDPTDATTFTQAGTIAVSGDGFNRYMFYDFAATTDSYIAIKVAGGENSQSIYVDDVVLDLIPSCWDVEDVTVSNITETGATVSWTPSTENTSATFTVKVGNTVVATGFTGTSYTVTGLNANSEYELTIYANCATNDASDGVVASFRTLCGSFNVPFTESFEASSNSIPCWTVVYNTDNPMGIGTLSGIGNAALRFSSYNNSDNYDQYAFSPVFGGGDYDSLHVKVRYSTYGSSDNLYFGYVINGDTVWGSQAYHTGGQTDLAYYEANIPVAATQLAIHYYGNYAYYAWIDSVMVTDFVPVYSVSIATDDATHGTVNPEGTFQVYLGDRVTATATPAQGWHFAGWVDGQNNLVNLTNPYLFYPTADMSLTATFEADPIFHTVTVLSANETMGTVAPAGPNTVQNGNTFIATATANSGYHFVAWVDANNQMLSAERTLRFTVSADVTVTATFEADPAQYTVTLSSANLLQGSVSPAGANVREEGSTFTATATPNEGYLFVAWTKNGLTQSTANPYSFQVTGDVTLIATFEAAPVYYTVNVATADATMGNVAPAGANEVEEGTSFTVTATALNGYHFVAWRSGNTVVSNEASYTFSVGANISLTATFEADPAQYVVTAISANTTMGEIDAAGNGGIYYEGDIATVLAVAHPGYRFVAWVDNAADTVVSTSAVYSFEVHHSIVLKATFTVNTVLPTYTVTVATANAAMGTVDPEGSWEVTSGERFTVTATPREGYEFVSWTVNGNAVSTSLTYIMEVYGNTSITANFRQKGAPVGIEDADLENVSIYSADSRIIVSGAAGKSVNVYDLSGRVLGSEMNAADRVEFRMSDTGVYLVKVGAAAAKRVLVVR